jgi:broad specificity phosphatase PhoE
MGLSPVGRARTETIANASWLARTTQIVASGERKAIETAEIIADRRGIMIEIRQAMHENDRSATGFLKPAEFEEVADRFFAEPHLSVRGWERAIDAQARIAREAEAVLARNRPGDILFVGHGAVGTLLFCHYAGHPIDRTHDQPAGGGHAFALVRGGRQVLHGWRKMEEGGA